MECIFRIRTRAFFAAAASASLLVGPVSAQATTFTQACFFGDSATDTGNDLALDPMSDSGVYWNR